jgi:hypothetical protein
MVLGSHTVGVRAPLDDAVGSAPVSVSRWLATVVIDDRQGGSFNRLRLIKAAANSGGATHYPPEIRNYFERLKSFEITAHRHNQHASMPYHEFEKHSLRQIAHEVIGGFDPKYRRASQIEAGAMMLHGTEAIPYHGRRLDIRTSIRSKPAPAILMSAPPHGFAGIAGPMMKLPYEGTPPRAPCPCGSGLKFKACCSEARDFSPEFIAEFEKRHGLVGRTKTGTTTG